MNSISSKFRFLCLALILALAGIFPAFTQTVDLTILSTSDLHNSYMDYDYYTDMPSEQFGLVRIATAIKAQRAQNPNVLLFDNGDNIQGNPIHVAIDNADDVNVTDFAHAVENFHRLVETMTETDSLMQIVPAEGFILFVRDRRQNFLRRHLINRRKMEQPIVFR